MDDPQLSLRGTGRLEGKVTRTVGQRRGRRQQSGRDVAARPACGNGLGLVACKDPSAHHQCIMMVMVIHGHCGLAGGNE